MENQKIIKHDVFISYRHDDAHIAALTESYLSNLGYDVFWDAHIPDEYMPAGEYAPVIDFNVKQCRDFILLVTANTFDKSRIVKDNDWIRHELALALQENRNIVPFLVGDAKAPSPDDLPFDINKVCDKEFFPFPIVPERRGKEEISSEIAKRLKATPSETEYQQILRRGSTYDATLSNEQNRLKIQSDNTYEYDMQILNKILADNPDKMFNVLDVGCAFGFVGRSRFVGDRFKKIIGIDWNAQCVASALEIAKKDEKFRKFKYHAINLEGNDFETQLNTAAYSADIDKFDIIIATQVLHHLKEPVAVLQSLRKFLAPGGYIIIRSTDDGTKIAGEDEDTKLIKRIIRATYAIEGIADRRSGRKIYGWLMKAGFIPENISMYSFMRDTSNMDYDERMKLYYESFGWRLGCFDTASEENSQKYVEMHSNLKKLEQRFPDSSFWYCGYEYIGVAHLPCKKG